MEVICAVTVDGEVGPVSLLDGYCLEFGSGRRAADEAARIREELERRAAAFEEARRGLEAVMAELRRYQEGVFAAHRREIAKLAVEIARRVLSQQVGEGDYRIEAIIAEAVGHVSGARDMVVYVHPEDLAACKKALAQGESDLPRGLRFVADGQLGRAECRIESEKGTVESLIQSHLEQIAKALTQAG